MRVERRFDVSAADLFDVERSSEFLAAKMAEFGGMGEPRVESSRDGLVVVRLPRKLPLEKVPGLLRKYAGSGEVVQVDRWRPVGEAFEAQFELEGAPKPLELTGRREIAPDGAGSRYTVTVDVRVKLPVIGGQAAKTVDDALTKLVTAELDFTDDWLARH